MFHEQLTRITEDRRKADLEWQEQVRQKDRQWEADQEEKTTRWQVEENRKNTQRTIIGTGIGTMAGAIAGGIVTWLLSANPSVVNVHPVIQQMPANQQAEPVPPKSKDGQ